MNDTLLQEQHGIMGRFILPLKPRSKVAPGNQLSTCGFWAIRHECLPQLVCLTLKDREVSKVHVLGRLSTKGAEQPPSRKQTWVVLAWGIPQNIPWCLFEITPRYHETLGEASPCFPGILLSRKPPEMLGKRLVFGKSDG